MPRAFSSGALSIWSYAFTSPPNFFDSTSVIAAVNVVFPWSTCPIVPTFTCGFVRSYFCFAIRSDPPLWVSTSMPQESARDQETRTGEPNAYRRGWSAIQENGAHERNRTADLLLTMQMLYRLSYVGGEAARSMGQANE